MKDAVILFLLSISWLIVYYALKYLRNIILLIFFKIPFFVYIGLWRYNNGIITLKKQLLKGGKEIDQNQLLEKIRLLDKKISDIENKDPKIYFKRIYRIMFLLFPKTYLKMLRNNELQQNTNILELDYSILCIFANEYNRKETAYLKIKHIPGVNTEKRKEIIESVKKVTKEPKLMELLEYNN